MRRFVFAQTLFFLGVLFFSSPCFAQAQDDQNDIEAELAILDEQGARDIAPGEYQRVLQLIRSAQQALTQGDEGLSQMLMSVASLQLQLLRELIRAKQLEDEAEQSEQSLAELEGARRRSLMELEEILIQLRDLDPLVRRSEGP